MMAHGKTESRLTCAGQAAHLGADYSDKLFYELSADIMCLKLVDKYDILNDDNSFTDVIDFEDIYKEDTIVVINENLNDIINSFTYTFIVSAFVNQTMNAYRKSRRAVIK